MPFQPINLRGKIVRNSPPLRYSVLGQGRRLCIMVSNELYRSFPHAEAWRMDVDYDSGRGRLTALGVNDNHPATKKARRKRERALRLEWQYGDDIKRFFPIREPATEIKKVNVNPQGIEFDLPAFSKDESNPPAEPAPEPEKKPAPKPAPKPEAKPKEDDPPDPAIAEKEEHLKTLKRMLNLREINTPLSEIAEEFAMTEGRVREMLTEARKTVFPKHIK